MKFLRKNWHLTASAFLGVLIFLAIFGLEPLRFTGIGWTQHGYGGHDITQHQIGWMFYRNSPWAFPLCNALFLGYPEGTSVSYTDSIPIAALFFKILSPVLPENFQYFGLYTCFCFLMQGLFAAALLFHTTKDRLYSVTGSVIFVTASCFVERCFRHTALASHWLILAALLLYLRRRKEPAERNHIWAGILLCISLGIHPYLFAMVFAILLLSEAEAFFACEKRGTAVFSFLICAGITFGFGYILGLFGTEVAPAKGFGMYSLNLNALINPNSAHHSRWSAFLPARELFAAQGDGMYYPGLMILILTVFVSVLLPILDAPSFFRMLRNNIWFIILLCGCTVFAVSNVITFDDRVLRVITLPDWLIDKLNIFRASARFFFIPYYCLFLYALSGLHKIFYKKHISAFLICLTAALLQTAEIRPGIEDLHRFFETRYDYIPLSEDWDRLAQNYNTARTFDCITNQSLAFWLAKTGFRTDMMVTAAIHMDAYWQRTESERNRLRKALADGTEIPDPDTIYIISTETGTNRSFENDSELEAYITDVRDAWSEKAELLYLTDWVRDYWVLCPNK